ncbi:MAG: thiamine phosphate synthase [Saprospiraceae bacterium]|nr:thiamine phosphate synthase [Saprospiraceae bacterium]
MRALPDLSLYLVTDSRLIGQKNLLSVVEPALKGGVKVVQFREKSMEAKEIFDVAMELRALTSKYNVPLIINDRLDIAQAVDADGVHLGQLDLPVEKVRKILGANKLIGFTVHNEAQAKAANQMDVDYVVAAPVFRTNTKLDTRGLLGFDGLRSILKVSKKPVIAAGGISLKNIAEVVDMDVDGVVVVNPIMTSDDPQLSAEKFVNMLTPMKI